MGTVAGGICSHPQCSTVMVVPRQVGVGLGQVAGSAAQTVVYVVDIMVGDRLMLVEVDEDVGGRVDVDVVDWDSETKLVELGADIDVDTTDSDDVAELAGPTLTVVETIEDELELMSAGRVLL
jgi:hypothetical protein